MTSSSLRNCLLCDRGFQGRTFLCRECSDYYRNREIPLDVRETFYTRLDLAYPARSNTYGSYNEPAALLQAIERLPRDARIIEVGAGGGFLARQLVDKGFTDITLTDLTDTAAGALVSRVPEADIVLTDAERLPFKDESFDVAISSDLIEHLPHPDTHLSEVARILTPGGLYLIKTPNRKVAETFYRLAGMHDAYFWHPSMFAPDELRTALDRHGFETRILRPPSLTGAQVAKLPAAKFTGPLARQLPVRRMPISIQPHLEVVARKTPPTS